MNQFHNCKLDTLYFQSKSQLEGTSTHDSQAEITNFSDELIHLVPMSNLVRYASQMACQQQRWIHCNRHR